MLASLALALGSYLTTSQPGGSGIHDRWGGHTRGQPQVPEGQRGPLAELTRSPTGPIRAAKTNKGSYYTPLMKDTGGQRGASWTPPQQKLLDPPHPHPPHPSISTNRLFTKPSPPPPASGSAPSTACVPLGCVTPGGPAEVREVGGSMAS